MTPGTGGAAVLGIDAAWTERQPSGVALIELHAGSWRLVGAAAASYAEFLGEDVAGDVPCPWPGAGTMLEEARRRLGGSEVSVVAADIPLARSPIRGRREADQEISRAFGAAGCSTHTPSVTSPGPLADRIGREFAAAGFELATSGTPVGTASRLIEVYPHPALLNLCSRGERLPYKAGKRRRYWKAATPAERLELLFAQWRAILAALRERIDGIAFDLPAATTGVGLKRFEDMLDALVCAWVGAEYVEGRARPYGDDDASIWVPIGAETEKPVTAATRIGAE